MLWLISMYIDILFKVFISCFETAKRYEYLYRAEGDSTAVSVRELQAVNAVNKQVKIGKRRSWLISGYTSEVRQE
jgi:hypothetical protein